MVIASQTNNHVYITYKYLLLSNRTARLWKLKTLRILLTYG